MTECLIQKRIKINHGNFYVQDSVLLYTGIIIDIRIYNHIFQFSSGVIL